MSRRNKKNNHKQNADSKKAFGFNDFFKMFGTYIPNEEKEHIPDSVASQMFAFADAIVHSRLTFQFDDLAKILRARGFAISKGRLISWMHEHQYLYPCDGCRNMPFAKYVEQGLFELNQYVSSEDGEIKTRFSTKITGKGMEYFFNLFINPQDTQS